MTNQCEHIYEQNSRADTLAELLTDVLINSGVSFSINELVLAQARVLCHVKECFEESGILVKPTPYQEKGNA